MGGDPWTLGLWALGLVLHAAVLLHARDRRDAFHPLTTLLLGTCLAAALSRDLFNLYVLMDLSSLLALVLIASGRRERAVWAGLQYLILTEVGLTLYLFGVGIVYGRFGTLSLSALAAQGADLSDPALRVGVGLLLAGAGVKTGVFLLGLWLPQAHGQAPTEVSTLLSGIVVKVGVLVMARLGEAFPVGKALLVLGLVTGFGGFSTPCGRRTSRCSSGSTLCPNWDTWSLGSGLGRGPELSSTPLPTACSRAFFPAAGEAVERAGKRTIAELAGQLSRPVALGLVLGTWAIAGLPPLAGFAAKGALAQGAPAWAKAAFYALGIGTAASFSKLLPLVRPTGPGKPGGLPILGGGGGPRDRGHGLPAGAPHPGGVGRGDPRRGRGVHLVRCGAPGSATPA